MKKALCCILIASTAFSGLFASGATEKTAEGGSGELYIYSVFSDAQYDLTVGKFNELYPDIKVYSTYGAAGVSKARIQAEGANPQADVMFGGLEYDDLADYGYLFDEYVSVNDVYMMDGYHNTSGKLSFNNVQYPCLVVNDEFEKASGILVTGWVSLLDPALYGKIVTADPTASSSAWNCLQCILTDFGGWDSEEAWDYIAKLMKNGLVVVSSSSIPYRSTFSGEYAVGLTFEPAVVRLLDGGQTGAHIVFPEEGVTSTGPSSAIILGAKNIENARLFIDFLQSDEGQQTFVDGGARPASSHSFKIESKHTIDIGELNLKIADGEAIAANKTAICDRWNEYWAAYGNH